MARAKIVVILDDSDIPLRQLHNNYKKIPTRAKEVYSTEMVSGLNPLSEPKPLSGTKPLSEFTALLATKLHEEKLYILFFRGNDAADECLRFFREHPEVLPHLVGAISDYNMGAMNGAEFIKETRALLAPLAMPKPPYFIGMSATEAGAAASGDQTFVSFQTAGTNRTYVKNNLLTLRESHAAFWCMGVSERPRSSSVEPVRSTGPSLVSASGDLPPLRVGRDISQRRLSAWEAPAEHPEMYTTPAGVTFSPVVSLAAPTTISSEAGMHVLITSAGVVDVPAPAEPAVTHSSPTLVGTGVNRQPFQDTVIASSESVARGPLTLVIPAPTLDERTTAVSTPTRFPGRGTNTETAPDGQVHNVSRNGTLAVPAKTKVRCCAVM